MTWNLKTRKVITWNLNIYWKKINFLGISPK